MDDGIIVAVTVIAATVIVVLLLRDIRDTLEDMASDARECAAAVVVPSMTP